MVSLNPEAGLKHWGSCQARDKFRTKNPEAEAWLVLIPRLTRWGDPIAFHAEPTSKDPRLLHMDRPCREGVWPPPGLLVVFPNTTLYSPLVRQLDPCGWQRSPVC